MITTKVNYHHQKTKNQNHGTCWHRCLGKKRETLFKLTWLQDVLARVCKSNTNNINANGTFFKKNPNGNQVNPLLAME